MFNFITQTIETSGYIGIVFLMFLENLFPPIPSEVIMPLAGYVAAQGALNVWGVLAAGIIGSLLGALPWYYLGYYFGLPRVKWLAARFGRVLTVTPEEVDSAVVWFSKYGTRAVLFGRLIPTIRTLISAPAGLARMGLPLFFFYSAIGTAIWTGLLVCAGFILESQYERVGHLVDPGTNIVIGIVIAVYVYRFMTFERHPKTAVSDLH